jgi:CO dehydrogenase nickel-insertion accessory protein CooC1
MKNEKIGEKKESKKKKRKQKKENEIYKKELKRFDPILKEIFSEEIGTIYYLAIGKKIGKKSKLYQQK